MTKEQLSNMLDLVYSQYDKDNETQKATQAFLNCIGEDGQICTTSIAEQINKAICIIDPEIADWISYFLWEVPSLQRRSFDPVIITSNWVEYDVSTREQQKGFLLSEYSN